VLTANDEIGVVIVEPDGRVQLWNAGATRMLGRTVTEGEPVTGAALDPRVSALFVTPRRRQDEPLRIGGASLLVSQRPISRRGIGNRTAGWVTELRDRTEAERLAGEGERLSARLAAELDATLALRARAHEADNRLHTMVTLVELGHVRQALDFATAVLARSRQLHESIQSTVADPILAALLLGKAARADEAGVALHVDPSTSVPVTGVSAQDLVLVLGNLVDNAIDAAAAMPPPRWVHVLATTVGDRLRLQVSDSGPGLPPEARREAFTAGWTTKSRPGADAAHGQGLGLALVAAAAQRLGGVVTVDAWVGARFVVDVPLPHADDADLLPDLLADPGAGPGADPGPVAGLGTRTAASGMPAASGAWVTPGGGRAAVP
jgi:two-component system, CitB family, sensor kinase